MGDRGRQSVVSLVCAACLALGGLGQVSGAVWPGEAPRAEVSGHEAAATPGAVAQGRRQARRGSAAIRHGWVQVYTNHAAQVTIDGTPYPKRSDHGMKITAGERHEVVVRLGDKEKSYVVVVRPRELRTLMVDLSGYQTPPTPAAPAVSRSPVATSAAAAPAEEEKEEEGDEKGKLTVYSKPKGEVYVDGSPLGATTPMINRELELGRHEVQVRWENGEMSEVKTIRIRKGSKLKLFFRDRSNNP